MQPSGGIERVVATLTNKLSNNFEITILVKDEAISFYKLNNSVKFASINNKVYFNMHNRFSRMYYVVSTIVTTRKLLASYLEINDFDYYYVTHPINALEFNLAGANTNKLIISEHAARSHYNIVYKTLKKLLYKNCYKYVVPTKKDAITYYQEDHFPAVNIPHFRSELLYTLAKKQDKIVLNVGRFTNDKQQLLLLKIWEKIKLNENYRNWVLHIVGSGELDNELRNFVKTYNLENSVEFLPPISQVERYYSQASIFVLTSKSEGYGMVLLEAISFGLPCVSFDCPAGPRDIIENGYNGYLVNLDDENEFQVGLMKLMNDEKFLDEMGNNAYKSSDKWSDNAILEKWLKILN
jgi:glycosyltransferase involved in cell wall biosynthesis